jgi:spermidine synthase
MEKAPATRSPVLRDIRSVAPLYLLFFLSGFPALLYQIVWQRALFAVYGVNIESVTVVVSAFMLGLGFGSLAGGRLSERRGIPLLAAFGMIELGIAGFGLCSLPLFRWVATFTAGLAPLPTGLIALALVFVPTLLMGATLPLLVAHLVRLSGNVGRSVGILYFVNTLGSAVACFAAAEFTMRHLGMSGSVKLAAAINTLIGCTVLALHFLKPRAAKPAPDVSSKSNTGLLPFRSALLLSAAAGFISLGYEIVWYRVYAFASEGSAKGFAYVLGAFLAGIAFGSLLSRRFCGAARRLPVAEVVLLANLLGFLTVPAIALAIRTVDYVWTLPLIAISAALLGAAFPLICHISIAPDARAGAGMSWLYLANIIGSALGSFGVGFVLMDVWPLRTIVLALALGGIATAALLAPSRQSGAMTAAVLGAIVTASSPLLFYDIYEKLQYKSAYTPAKHFTDLVETRSGVVSVDADGVVYGGGHYDGMLETDLSESDAPLRPYALSFFHPDPREALLIGMAGGAWAEVVANHPQVERMTIVEINPGYLAVMKRYPEVAPVLTNPRAEIFIDDGRRWLVRNPERRYDVILMDTTSHWRAHVTNLLSVEFLRLARAHLKPGGILYYNTTHSPEAQQTALMVFPYAYRFGRFLAVSDQPIRVNRERWRNVLVSYTLEGHPVFDMNDPEDRGRVDEVLAWADTLDSPKYDEWGMEDLEHIRRRVAGHRIITDDNMASEWGR